jgi:hypothetical protein
MFSPICDFKTGKPKQKVRTAEVFSIMSSYMQQELGRLGHQFPSTFHLGTSACNVAHCYCNYCSLLLKVFDNGIVVGDALRYHCIELKSYNSARKR